MAWNYNNRVIREGRSWTDDNGVTHPTNWGSWSEAEKATAGLVFVADPAPFDNRFFWDANTSVHIPLRGQNAVWAACHHRCCC